MRAALEDGASAARDAVRELRDLANGLHPQEPTDGGLPAVLDDLARRSNVPMVVAVFDDDLPTEVAFTAPLVITGAVVNAQQPARADRIEVRVATGSQWHHDRGGDPVRIVIVEALETIALGSTVLDPEVVTHLLGGRAVAFQVA